MFTGLIEDVGKLVGREKQGQTSRLQIATHLPTEDIQAGDSIAVNGACLTAEKISGGVITFYTLSETLQRTNLGRCPVGASLNLERALRAGDRLGGHFVMGHIDTVATIQAIQERQQDIAVDIALSAALKPLLIPKGSIAVNGISLTVADLSNDRFSVHIIPHTWDHTNLAQARAGDLVNLEGDMIGKYVLRFQQLQSSSPTMGSLRDAGFLGE